jgi:HK97 family phage major capsid protein
MKFKEWLASKGYELKEDTTAEVMAGYYNEFNELKANELKDAVIKENKELISELKAELVKNQLEQSKEINNVLKEQGLAIKNINDLNKGDVSIIKGKTVKEQLKDNEEAIKSLNTDNKNGRVSFKAVGTMLISSNVSGGNVPVEQRLEGLNALASRQVRLLDIVSRGTASSNVISWVYQANKEGAAGTTAEGALKNQIDFDLVVNSESVKKMTAFIKVSEEMLNDIDFMQSEINNELMRELLKVVEAQVYEGDGTGNNLNGIRTVATAFAAGTFAASIDNANAVDVLTVATDQIMIAEQPMPNYILMHPSDVTALKMVKVSATDKRYVERLALVAGNLSLDGIPILPTTLVTQDEYLIGAFDMAQIYDKGSVSIEIGRDSDDFTKNLVTVLAEWRGLVIVKNNDRAAFIKGVISTDAAALETA